MEDSLRFITCGSVDDGKSTLIGRLLFETKQIYEDQLAAVERDSLRFGTQNGQTDLALVMDGLRSEREQGITIDVAYRYFSTSKRRFVIADTPGHEQYTRNMATAASSADAAVLVVDSRKGLTTQTLRHTRIVAMMGISHVILAVNKMDLTNWDQLLFERIQSEYLKFAEPFGFSGCVALPISALDGSNVVEVGKSCPWYRGESLLSYLENLESQEKLGSSEPFRMAVQWVNRPNPDFRGYCGRISMGNIRVGDEISFASHSTKTKVKELFIGTGRVDQAERGDAVMLTFTDPVEAGRGELIASGMMPAMVSQLRANVVCLNGEIKTGSSYLFKAHGGFECLAEIVGIEKWDIHSGEISSAEEAGANDCCRCTLRLDRSRAMVTYNESRALGSFLLVDRISHATLAGGMIQGGRKLRSQDVTWQHFLVSKNERASLKQQKPRCLWLTGLSAAGKTTIANQLEKQLYGEGLHTYILDGDNLRHGLNGDLAFSQEARSENVRRTAEVAKLMVDAGLIVIVSLISPLAKDRHAARSLFGDDEFVEVFVDAPLECCEKRDPKGLYDKARNGESFNFTGISSPYEAPKAPEVHLRTDQLSVEECVRRIRVALRI